VAVEPGLSELLRTTPALAQANPVGVETLLMRVRRAAIVAVARRLIRLRWPVVLLISGLILGPAAAQDHQRAPVPGAVDPHVTQATIHDTICQRGYTARVRPSRKVTDAIKRRLANGLPGSPQDYELDHLIPLGLGGHPTSPNNFWLQSWTEATIKDRDELRLHREVCMGRMTLEQAQREMVTKWGPRE
jgi:hypothetical protein